MAGEARTLDKPVGLCNQNPKEETATLRNRKKCRKAKQKAAIASKRERCRKEKTEAGILSKRKETQEGTEAESGGGGSQVVATFTNQTQANHQS